MTPPRFATWLLESTGLPDADAIAGDLCEEFEEHVARTRSAGSARCWFCWQAARSMTPMCCRTWQRASATRAAAALGSAAAVATMPTTALLALRSFTLSQVPLKTTAEFSPAFAALALAVASVSALAGTCFGVRLLHRRYDPPK